VVWLWGEHDLSTDDALSATLARAIALGSAGLLLDLGEVEFMAVSTLGVIVRARSFLQQRSRWLKVRRPSAFVRRVIIVCGLTDLLYPGPELAGDVPGEALGSWVAVPAVRRPDARSRPSAPVLDRVPVRAGRPSALRPRGGERGRGLAETA
jgi:anti-anti-sigma factor